MKEMITADSLSVLLWSHRLMDGYRLVTPEVRDRDPLRPLYGLVAQLVAQLLCKQKVTGSSPVPSTKY